MHLFHKSRGSWAGPPEPQDPDYGPAGSREASAAAHQNSASLFQLDVNGRPVQSQRHAVQEAHVFTAPLLEVGQNLEVWWDPQQRVPAPVLHRVLLALEVHHSRTRHRADGAQRGGRGAAGGGRNKHQDLLLGATATRGRSTPPALWISSQYVTEV